MTKHQFVRPFLSLKKKRATLNKQTKKKKSQNINKLIELSKSPLKSSFLVWPGQVHINQEVFCTMWKRLKQKFIFPEKWCKLFKIRENDTIPLLDVENAILIWLMWQKLVQEKIVDAVMRKKSKISEAVLHVRLVIWEMW